jgi:hypothetical protein
LLSQRDRSCAVARLRRYWPFHDMISFSRARRSECLYSYKRKRSMESATWDRVVVSHETEAQEAPGAEAHGYFGVRCEELFDHSNRDVSHKRRDRHRYAGYCLQICRTACCRKTGCSGSCRSSVRDADYTVTDEKRVSCYQSMNDCQFLRRPKRTAMKIRYWQSLLLSVRIANRSTS